MFANVLAEPLGNIGQRNVQATKEALAKENECFKCHTIDKTKKGPSYRKIAEKNRGKADAEAKLIKHITTGPRVKLEDGTEEDHKIIETKDDAEIKNLVHWIFAPAYRYPRQRP